MSVESLASAQSASSVVEKTNPEISSRYVRVLNDTDPRKVDMVCAPYTGVHWPKQKVPEVLTFRQISSMHNIGSGANSLGTTWDESVSPQSVTISQLFRADRPFYPVGQVITGVRASDGAFVVRMRNFGSDTGAIDFVDVLPGETKTHHWGSPDDPELTWTVSHSATRFVPVSGTSTFDGLTDIKVAVYERGPGAKHR